MRMKCFGCGFIFDSRDLTMNEDTLIWVFVDIGEPQAFFLLSCPSCEDFTNLRRVLEQGDEDDTGQ